MNDKELWIASIEAKVLKNFELNDDGSEYQFVECLFMAGCIEEIIAEIKQVLPTIGLNLTDVSKCRVHNPTD